MTIRFRPGHARTLIRQAPYWIAAFCVIVALLSEAVACARAGCRASRPPTAICPSALPGSGRRCRMWHWSKLDDQTLAMHPDDPLVFWTPHFARAAAGPAHRRSQVIGLDFLFSASRSTGSGRFPRAARSRAASTAVFVRNRQWSCRARGMQSGAEPLLLAADYLSPCCRNSRSSALSAQPTWPWTATASCAGCARWHRARPGGG